MALHHRRQDGGVGQRPRSIPLGWGSTSSAQPKRKPWGKHFSTVSGFLSIQLCATYGAHLGLYPSFLQLNFSFSLSPLPPLCLLSCLSLSYFLSVTSSLCLPLSFSPLLSFPSFLPPVCHLCHLSVISLSSHSRSLLSCLLSLLSSHSVSVSLLSSFSSLGLSSVILSIILSLFFHVSVIASLSSHCLCHSPFFFLFSQVSVILSLSLFLTPPFPTSPGILFQVGQMPTVEECSRKAKSHPHSL